MFTGLTDTQLSGMGTALSQGGTGLLHIAIQLMPYAIAFTIILLIFGLIKNWSKLSNKWESGYYKKGTINSIYGDSVSSTDYSRIDSSIDYLNGMDSYSGIHGNGYYKREGKKLKYYNSDFGDYWSKTIFDDVSIDDMIGLYKRNYSKGKSKFKGSKYYNSHLDNY